MNEIKLTKGKIALVDDEDFDYLNQWRWKAREIKGTWYVSRNQHVKGVNGKYKSVCVFMHRAIMNSPANKVVDHIDHNGLNNQKSNLRICTHQQNTMNHRKNKTTGFCGVSIEGRKFAAQIHFGDYASLNYPEEEVFDPEGLNQPAPYRVIGEAFLIDTEPISYEKQS